MGKTTQQMNKALEQGQVLAKDLLPKLIPLMDKLANNNDALTTQLNTAQTAQNRFNLTMQEGADIIWKSGMSEGMKDLFETSAKSIKKLEPSLKKLGKAFEIAFKGLARAIEFLTPVLQLLIDNLEWIIAAKLAAPIFTMVKAIKAYTVATTAATAATATLGATATASFMSILKPLALVVTAMGVIEDLAADIDPTKVSSGEAAQGFQMIDGKRVAIHRREDGSYYSKGEAATGRMAELDRMLNPSLGGAFSDVKQWFGSDSNNISSSTNKTEINVNVTGTENAQQTKEVVEQVVDSKIQSMLHAGSRRQSR